MRASTPSGSFHKDDCRPLKIEFHARWSEADSRAGAASALLQHPELHVAHLANTSWLFAHGDASGELKQHWAKRFSGMLCTPRLFLQFVEQRLGFLQVGGVKALGEPGVERCQ